MSNTYQDKKFFVPITEPLFIPPNKYKVAVDSGAHTIWMKEFKAQQKNADNAVTDSIDWSFSDSKEFKTFLESYIAWIHKNKHLLDFYITMDVIYNPEKSWELTEYMESCGLNPLPVYHFGEDISWFKKMLDKYEYICISGMTRSRKSMYTPFGDQVFDLIKDSTGRPRAKIHGLAMATPEFIKRYPWYSCDASTWMNMSKNGTLLIPKPIFNKDNELIGRDYLDPPFCLATTERRIIASSSLERQSQSFIDYIYKYIEENGYTFEDIRQAYHARDVCNARWFYSVENQAKKYYAECFNYPEGGNLYMAGMPSGASGVQSKYVKLLYDLKLDHTNWLPSFAYRKHLDNCIKVKEHTLQNKDLVDLQKSCTTKPRELKPQQLKIEPTPPPVIQRKRLHKNNPPLQFEATVTYKYKYSIPYNYYGTLDKEQILKQELEHFKSCVPLNLENIDPNIEISII